MPARRDTRSCGFTLLEVVVALVIAGLALVALFQAGSAGLIATDTGLKAEQAVQRAQSHLAAVGHGAALVEGVSSGDDGDGYRWQLAVTPLAQRELSSGGRFAPRRMTLFSVAVTISWRSGGRRRQVVLKTLRLSGGRQG